jgi:hypothetical protein
MIDQTYLTTDELSSKIKYDVRTIRERLKDSVLLEGMWPPDRSCRISAGFKMRSDFSPNSPQLETARGVINERCPTSVKMPAR